MIAFRRCAAAYFGVCAAVGGEPRLAKALQVPLANLRRWLNGEIYPPTSVFQKALDLLIGIGAK